MGKWTKIAIVCLGMTSFLVPVFDFGLSNVQALAELGLPTVPHVGEAGYTAYTALFWSHFLTNLPMVVVLTLLLVGIVAFVSGACID